MEADAPAEASTRRSRIGGRLTIAVTGVLLAVGFLPLVYNRVQTYDDEGALLLGIREFIHRGSIYDHSSAYYGPFYYSFFGGFFRLLGTDPTPFSGRLTVLVLTALAAGLFAATVYRLTRSVAAAVLCQVATFGILIRSAGFEPMHPSVLIDVLLGLLVYCLASNCIRPRRALLVVAGFSTAAIVMTKINVGMFVVLALLIWLIVGNTAVPYVIRVLAIAGAALFPFALMSSTLTQTWTAIYAVTVGIALLLLCAVATTGAPLPNAFRIAPFAIGAGVTVLVSPIWPLAHGTSLSSLIDGVLIRPTNQTDIYTVPADIRLSWPLLLIAAIGVAAAAVWRDPRVGGRPIRDEHWAIVLGVAGLAILGLGAFGSFVAWLPVIVLLPALALFITSERTASSLIVLTVAIAIGQALHAYPVAGSQVTWSTFAMVLPCSIAVGVGLRRSREWNGLRTAVRATGTVAMCTFLLVALGWWPPGFWNEYLDDPPLDLPGTSLVRLDPNLTQVTTETLQEITAFLIEHCDTFYSAPPSDSLYIYTKIPSPTGLTIDWYGVLNSSEQLEIVEALHAAAAEGKRVCIVREAAGYASWAASTTGQGPLGAEVSQYTVDIGDIGNYSVWTRPG